MLGLDPATLAFPSARNEDVQPTPLTKIAPLSDEEWALIFHLCPSEDRANSWGWREFIDTELWALSPKNTMSALSTANAHRCRKRRAAVRGDFDRLVDAIGVIAGISDERRRALLRIFEACAAEGERVRAKAAVAKASLMDRPSMR